MSSKFESVIKQINEGVRIQKVDLSNSGLTDFPVELFALFDCLEVLNLGGNQLSSLPNEIVQFSKLRILFFAQNSFKTIPEQLGSMNSLFMLSFKSNKVESISPASLSKSIAWLILTDNLIEGT
jgi:Leucine-rich repeat (LRR) protein